MMVAMADAFSVNRKQEVTKKELHQLYRSHYGGDERCVFYEKEIGMGYERITSVI
jgi:hypothetical protein